jgi:hypothetical protein
VELQLWLNAFQEKGCFVRWLIIATLFVTACGGDPSPHVDDINPEFPENTNCAYEETIDIPWSVTDPWSPGPVSVDVYLCDTVNQAFCVFFSQNQHPNTFLDCNTDQWPDDRVDVINSFGR